jgi:hypothetical protein
MAQSEQRSIALGQPSVWSFSEHVNATLPDHEGERILASLWVPDGDEGRFLNDASELDAWVSLEEDPDRCEHPEVGPEHDASPPASVQAACADGWTVGIRCVPTLAGHRRHITTEITINSTVCACGMVH